MAYNGGDAGIEWSDSPQAQIAERMERREAEWFVKERLAEIKAAMQALCATSELRIVLDRRVPADDFRQMLFEAVDDLVHDNVRLP